MDKIRTLLFGMTGFGNNALSALLEIASVELIGILTVSRPNVPFPYYECEQLHDAAKVKGVSLYEGLNLKEERTHSLIKDLSPNMIVVSAFNQIITKPIISIPRLGVINIHPSLLPKYRGATPTVWVLMNGEKKTGVTVHLIEDEKIDQGRIISQHLLNIVPMDTDGSLRQKLAKLSEIALREAIEKVLAENKDLFLKQDESEATYYPKRTVKDAEININRPFGEILNKIRAMTPCPGASLIHNNKVYLVRDAELLKENISGSNLKSNSKQIVVRTNEGFIKFHVAEENIKGGK